MKPIFFLLCFLSVSSWAMTRGDVVKIVHEIKERKTNEITEMVTNYYAGNFKERQLFHDILLDEYVPLFAYLLEKKKLDPNYRWKNTERYDEARLLHACVCNDKYKQTELLLRYGADVNVTANPGTPDFFGHSYYPIFYAIGEQDCKMVELLGKYNADFNLLLAYRRPLVYAVYLYSLELESEAKAKFRNDSKWLAEVKDRKKNSFNIIRLLTQHGADPDARSSELDGKKTSFELAKEKGAEEVVQLFETMQQKDDMK